MKKNEITREHLFGKRKLTKQEEKELIDAVVKDRIKKKLPVPYKKQVRAWSAFKEYILLAYAPDNLYYTAEDLGLTPGELLQLRHNAPDDEENAIKNWRDYEDYFDDETLAKLEEYHANNKVPPVIVRDWAQARKLMDIPARIRKTLPPHIGPDGKLMKGFGPVYFIKSKEHKKSLTEQMERILQLKSRETKMPVKTQLLKKVVDMALDGDKKMIELIWNYVEGKPVNRTEYVNKNEDNGLTKEQKDKLDSIFMEAQKKHPRITDAEIVEEATAEDAEEEVIEQEDE